MQNHILSKIILYLTEHAHDFTSFVRLPRSLVDSNRKKYLAVIALDLISMVTYIGGAKHTVFSSSPRLASASATEVTPVAYSTYESQTFGISELATFSFAPGSSRKKLDQITLDGLGALSYYDLPVDTDGTIFRYTSNYENFRASGELIARAHQRGTKVLATLTALNTLTIKDFLKDPAAQDRLMLEARTEVQEMGIDGVNVDFEFSTGGKEYRSNYLEFISTFATKLHHELPNSFLAVTLSGSALTNEIYDISRLAATADAIYLQAYDFAAPEFQHTTPMNPVFGYSEWDYWTTVTGVVNEFLRVMPAHKLVIERAWYGNGNEYPFYQDTEVIDDFVGENTLETPLRPEIIDGLVARIPGNAQKAGRENIPFIAEALKKEHILTPNVLAYALATIEHETAGTFAPIEEIKGRRSARRLGYEGGTNYFGRGFIQLTHLRNYKRIGVRIGLGDDLVQHPELALTADVSARVLAAFFKDNGVARRAYEGNFIAARTPVNPDDYGPAIAELAYKFRNAI